MCFVLWRAFPIEDVRAHVSAFVCAFMYGCYCAIGWCVKGEVQAIYGF